MHESVCRTSQTFISAPGFFSIGYAGCLLLFRIQLGFILPQLLTMQGRASKAPKKELVIESPQQYRSLAAAEAEVDAVPQVVVSHLRASYKEMRLSGLNLLEIFSDLQVHLTVCSCCHKEKHSHKVLKQVSCEHLCWFTFVIALMTHRAVSSHSETAV